MSEEYTPTPTRPYMIRAIHEWIEDNQLTAYLLVDATFASVMVPAEFVKDGQIVLNMSSGATHKLLIANDAISFSARFGGVPRNLYIPMPAVLGIYAKQNGQGLFFDPSEYAEVDLSAVGEHVETHPPADKAELSQQERVEKAKKSGFRVLE